MLCACVEMCGELPDKEVSMKLAIRFVNDIPHCLSLDGAGRSSVAHPSQTGQVRVQR